MKLEPTGEGFTIEAHDLAPLLDLSPEKTRELMRAGRITSLVERGEGADAGRYRVTFRCGTLRLRLIVDAQGEVLKRSRVDARPR